VLPQQDVANFKMGGLRFHEDVLQGRKHALRRRVQIHRAGPPSQEQAQDVRSCTSTMVGRQPAICPAA
jgi:hypothetical protein